MNSRFSFETTNIIVTLEDRIYHSKRRFWRSFLFIYFLINKTRPDICTYMTSMKKLSIIHCEIVDKVPHRVPAFKSPCGTRLLVFSILPEILLVQSQS